MSEMEQPRIYFHYIVSFSENASNHLKEKIFSFLQ